MRFLIAAAVVLALASAAHAATIPVAPGGDVVANKAAVCGDTLAYAGAFDHVLVKGRVCPPDNRLTFDLSAATVANFRGQNVEGIIIRGGAFAASDSLGAMYFGSAKHISVQGITTTGDGTRPGVTFRDSADVELIGSRIEGPSLAVSIYNTDGFLVQGNALLNMGTDGVDMFAAHHGKMLMNSCAGARLIDLHHPDCGQLASLKGYSPTSDIEIAYNVGHGASQGWSGFDHGTGGFDRISIHDNTGAFAYPQGINLDACRACVVKNNHLRTLPGAAFKTTYHYENSPGTEACGNRADAYGGKPASADGPCP